MCCCGDMAQAEALEEMGFDGFCNSYLISREGEREGGREGGCLVSPLSVFGRILEPSMKPVKLKSAPCSVLID